jgi:hypothetical protein
MKRFNWFLVVAALTAGAAHAQKSTVEPAIPQGISDSRIDARSALSPPAPELGMNRSSGGRDTDARACLALASNTQIHRCAEPYRGNVTRAAGTRAKLSKPESGQSAAATAKTTVPNLIESQAKKP